MKGINPNINRLMSIPKLACAWIAQFCKQRFTVRCLRGVGSRLCRGRGKSYELVNYFMFCNASPRHSELIGLTLFENSRIFCLKVICLSPNSSYLIKTPKLWFQTSWHSLSVTGKICTWRWFRFWKPLPPREPQARELLSLTSQLSEMNWYVALISHRDNAMRMLW